MRPSLVLPLAVLLGLGACAPPAPARSPTRYVMLPDLKDPSIPVGKVPKRWCYEVGNAPAQIRPRCEKSPDLCEAALAEARRGGLADGFGDPFSECRAMRREDFKRPRRLSGKAPFYSPEAREAGVGGKVVAECIITATGTIEKCQIIKSLPALDQAVLDALATWRFEPMYFVGRAVSTKYTVPFVFKP